MNKTDSINEFTKELYEKIKPFIKPFLIVFFIYCVSMLSIWRAGASFIDDMGRSVSGYAWDTDFNRYTSSYISRMLQLDSKLTDISPLIQIVAMAFVSASSVTITYLFCDKKIKYLPLVLATFVGICPFITECWLYKFDAMPMALSVLASTAPFLCWSHAKRKLSRKQYLTFATITLSCLMVMWTSYQASSGIFLVMILGMSLKDYLNKIKLKAILLNSVLFSAAYLISAAIFKFALPPPISYGQNTATLPLSEIINGTYHNVKKLGMFLRTSLSIEWLILIIVFAVCFIVGIIVFSKRRGWLRLADAIAASTFIIVSVPSSYGAYLILQNPPQNGRSALGIGVILAIASVLLTSNMTKIWTKMLAIPSLMLLYSFFVFNFALGNALADQERYGLYRTESLLTDLSGLYPTKESVAITTLQIQNRSGLSAVASHVNSQYPITRRIITEQQYGLADYAWGRYKLLNYYNRTQNGLGVWEEEWDCTNWSTQLNTYYHAIKTDGNGRICVVLK